MKLSDLNWVLSKVKAAWRNLPIYSVYKSVQKSGETAVTAFVTSGRLNTSISSLRGLQASSLAAQLIHPLFLLCASPTHLSLASLDFICKSSNMSICCRAPSWPREELNFRTSCVKLINLAALVTVFYTFPLTATSGFCLWQWEARGLNWIRPKKASKWI